MKLDGLKARLLLTTNGPFPKGAVGTAFYVNPDGPEAAQAIIDLEALVEELGKSLRRFVADFEGDFCVEGVIVDDPDLMLKTHYVLARATLAKLEKARGKDQEHG